MRYDDASLTGSFQDVRQGPDARDDADALAAGDRGPATGNTISGAGTVSGAAGADLAEGAKITAIEGAGGSDTSFSGGQLRVAGEHGTLTINARGDYSYAPKAGAPENVRDVFTYTLSGKDGSDTARLTIELGKTPAVIQANAQRIVPGPDGVVTLPAGVDLSDIRAIGRDLVVMLPDGTQLVIVDGAIFVPQLLLGTVEVPATNLAALLVDSEPQPAAGVPQSGGGNFDVPLAPLDPGVALGDLIAPTELAYTPPEFREPAFSINDADRLVDVGANPLVALDEDVLAGGVNGGVGDIADAGPVASGTLSGSGGDGALVFDLLPSGAPAGFTYVDGPNGSVLVQQVQGGATVTVLTITLDPATGVYSVTQNAPVLHPAGGDENNVEFTIAYTVTDQDGDTASGSLTVNVDDDSPVVDVTAGADGAILLQTQDADTIGAATDSATSSANFGGVFGLTQGAGADGSAAPASLSFALNITAGASGLTQAGVAINLFMVGGRVVGSTATSAAGIASGNTVFDVSVNGSGVVTLTQYSQIDHPVAADPSPTGAPFADHLVSLADGLVTLSASAGLSDRDGDSASDTATVAIGANLQFADDGPRLTNAVSASGIVIDETAAGSPAGFPLTATSLAAVISATAAFGADGPAASGATSYGLQIVGGGTTPLRTAIGDFPITLVQTSASVVTGTYVEGGVTRTAFTVTINANGTLTVTENVPLEHLVDGEGTAAAYNDELTLDGLLNATITVRDFDGDTATASAAVGQRISFFDDGPRLTITVGSDANVILTTDDADTIGAATDTASSTANFSGVFGLSFAGGADGAATPVINYSLGLGSSASGLTSNGAPITLVLSGGRIVGTTATSGTPITAANTIFDVRIDAAGVVTLTQYGQVDHPVQAGANDAPFADQFVSLPDGAIRVNASAVITDNDGDTASDMRSVAIGANLRFTDDGPDASVAANVVLDTLVLDESRPAGSDTAGGVSPGGLASTTANFADNFGTTVDFGADGPGTARYSLVLNGQNVGSGLFALDSGDTSTADTDGFGQGAEITLSQNGNLVTGSAGGVDYFTITIDSVTGAVTFTQLQPIWQPTPGASFDEASVLNAVAGALVVRQTVTDFDGDTDSADLDVSRGVFQIQDDGPTASNEAVQSLAEGTSVSGQFDFDPGEDGGRVTAVNGVALVFDPVTGLSQPVSFGQGTIVVRADGSYTYTANNPGAGTASGTFTVTDGDGDTASATFGFTITDANVPTAGASAALADDDGLAGGNPASTAGDIDAEAADLAPDGNEAVFHGALNFGFGGDGAGSLSFAAMNGTTGQVGQEQVAYSVSADGLTLTATGPRGALFTVALDDGTSGNYTLTLLDNVLHAPGNDETSAPNVALTFTVTDADNSQAGGTLNVEFNDDAPSASVTLGTGAEPVLTTQDAETDGVPISEDVDSTAVDFGGYFTFASSAGADGGTTVKSFDFDVLVKDSGLTSGGLTVNLYDLGNGLVIGSTAATAPAGVTDPSVVFTVAADADGVVTLTQYQQIDHAAEAAPANAPFDDQLAILGNGRLVLNGTLTVTDGDGDVATDTEQLDLGGNIRFADDGPALSAVAAGSSVSVDETAARTGLPISDTSDAPIITATQAFGADGAAASGAISYTLSISSLNGATALRTAVGDFPITLVQSDAQTITGTYQNGGTQTAFVVTINGDGTLSYRQDVALEHNQDGASAADHNDTLTLAGLISASITLTDFDGDTATATVPVGDRVTIFDDGPSASADSDIVTEGGSTTGNVLDGTGTTPPIGPDVPGADGYGSPRVTGNASVNQGTTDTSATGGNYVLVGQYGTLTLGVNGGYTYQANANAVTANQQDIFEYTIQDADGDVSTARLTINVLDVTIPGPSPTVQVNEAALDLVDDPADLAPGTAIGSNPTSGAETVSGTVAVAGVTYTPQSVTTGLGVFQLNADGTFTYTLTAPVDGSTANNGANNQPGVEAFVYSGTDAGGNSVTGTITVDVIDDVPTARDDLDSLGAVGNSATGNVISGAGTTTPAPGGADTTGADGASVTRVVGFNGSTDDTLDGASNLQVNGQHGALSLNADGTYTYTRNAGTPGGVSDSFTYTLTDGDGDVSTATLTIAIPNRAPVAGSASAAVDDDGLIQGTALVGNGNPNSSNGDLDANAGESGAGATNEAVFAGTLQGTPGDGTTTFLFAASLTGTTATVGTETVVYGVSGDGLTLTATGPRGLLFTVQITDAQSGAYTLTLNDNVQHETLNTAAGDNSENDATLTIPYQMRDGDGSVSATPGALNITFDDDMPSVNSAGDVTLTGLSSSTGAFGFAIGADNAFNPLNASAYLSATVSGSVDGRAITITQQPTYAGTVNGIASYGFGFTYDADPGAAVDTRANTGTISSNENGTYSVTLAQPIVSLTTNQSSSAVNRVGYDLADTPKPEVVVSQLGTTSPFYMQFTGAEVKNGAPLQAGTNTTFTAGELFTAAQAFVSVGNGENGVASDTIQNGEVLDFSLFQTNPGGTITSPTPQNQVAASGLTLRLDGIGNTTDLVVVVKLYDTVAGTYTTSAVIVGANDIYRNGDTIPAGYSTGGALDNNDGFVIIEANDYQMGNPNLVMVGAQLLTSTGGITGSGIDLNRATGTTGGSATTQLFGDSDTLTTDPTNDQDVIKIVDIGIIRTVTTPQFLSLDFNVTLTDSDGDSVSQHLLVNPTQAAAQAAPAATQKVAVQEPISTALVADMDAASDSRSSYQALRSTNAANSNTTLMAVTAAAGIALAAPAAAEETHNATWAQVDPASLAASPVEPSTFGTLAAATSLQPHGAESVSVVDRTVADPASKSAPVQEAPGDLGGAGHDGARGSESLSELSAGTEAPAFAAPAPAAELHMPSAEALAALAGASNDHSVHGLKSEIAVQRVIADALDGGGEAAPSIARLLDALPAHDAVRSDAHSGFAEVASPADADVSAWNSGHFAPLFHMQQLTMEAAALHHDAVQPVQNG